LERYPRPLADTPYAGVPNPTGFLEGRPAWIRYAFAITLTIAAFALRRWLDVFGEGLVAFSLFYPVILICTLLGGVGPGFLSLLLSGLAVMIFWLEPRGTLAATGPGLINLILFVFTAGATIFIANRLRSADYRLRRNEARLSLSQEVGRIGVWEMDLKSGQVWWSPMLREVAGFAPDTVASADTFMDRIDPADRQLAVAALESASSGLRRMELEFRFRRDDGTIMFLANRAEIFRDAAGNPSHLIGVAIDVTSMRTVQSERDQATSLLRTFFESLPGAAYAKDLDGRILLGNAGFAAAVGHPPGSFLGKTDAEFIADKDHAEAIMAHDRAVLQANASLQLEEDFVLPDGQLTHWLSIKTPFTDASGQPRGLVGISLDMTERHKSEERLRFLADEVDHRAKNLLGVVLSVVRLTKVDDVDAFKAAVSGRIRALARAHTLLAASRWQGVDIGALVHEELAPFEGIGTERIEISGPAVRLEPSASQALAMVIHELAINAGTYGALSVEQGRLTVSWRAFERDAQTCLELFWTEVGGPPVSSPVNPGFGSTAIRGAIEHQLGGEIDLQWAPSGVSCRIVIPLSRGVVQPEPSENSKKGIVAREVEADLLVDLRGKRVLVLDDEALIALTVGEMIRELGCEVVGPAHSLAAARDLLRRGAPDLAMLDINLAGTSSAPIARALRALEVPFIYCTGYAEPALQVEPGLEAEMLTKPTGTRELGSALRRALAR
jgi:PAS domain S-box-containing protein